MAAAPVAGSARGGLEDEPARPHHRANDGRKPRLADGPGPLGYSDAMVGWIRTVLVWMLVLALPAQGAAAATMVFCNPNHPANHPAAGSLAASHHRATTEAGPQALAHGHAHVMAHDLAPHSHSAHEGGGDDGQAATGARADNGSDTVGAAADLSSTKLAQADQHKCSACASCCSAAVIGNTTLDVPAPELRSTGFISVVPTVEKFAADGPDRPPRIHLV